MTAMKLKKRMRSSNQIAKSSCFASWDSPKPQTATVNPVNRPTWPWPVEQEVQHIGTDEKETMLRFFTSAETCKKPVLLLRWIGKNDPQIAVVDRKTRFWWDDGWTWPKESHPCGKKGWEWLQIHLVYVLTSLIKDILSILANLFTLCSTCTKYAKNSSNRRRPCVVSWLPWPPISSLGSRAHRATISWISWMAAPTISPVNCPANPLKFRYQTGKKEHVKSVTYINIRFKWFKYDLKLVKLCVCIYIYVPNIQSCFSWRHKFYIPSRGSARWRDLRQVLARGPTNWRVSWLWKFWWMCAYEISYV